MYTVGFDKKAEKEFLELDKQIQELVANKIIDLRNGYFSRVTLIRIARRKEVY